MELYLHSFHVFMAQCLINYAHRQLYLFTTNIMKYFYCHVVWSDYRRGFGFDIGFTDHLQVVITNTHNTIAHFHTLQITTSHAKYFPGCSIFTRCSLITASNSVYSSASALKPPHRRLPSNCLLITPLHGPKTKHRFQQYFYCCMCIRRRGDVFTEPLPRYGSTRYITFFLNAEDRLKILMRFVGGFGFIQLHLL
jgi:hypothetical protein